MFLELFNKIFNFLKNNYLWYKTKYLNPNQLYEYNFFSVNKLDFNFPKLIILENEKKECLDISDYIPIYNMHNKSELFEKDVFFLEKMFDFKDITKINILDSENNLKEIQVKSER